MVLNDVPCSCFHLKVFFSQETGHGSDFLRVVEFLVEACESEGSVTCLARIEESQSCMSCSLPGIVRTPWRSTTQPWTSISSCAKLYVERAAYNCSLFLCLSVPKRCTCSSNVSPQIVISSMKTCFLPRVRGLSLYVGMWQNPKRQHHKLETAVFCLKCALLYGFWLRMGLALRAGTGQSLWWLLRGSLKKFFRSSSES